MAKVVMLIDSLGSGGAQRQLVHLAAGLKRSGYEVVVIYYHAHEFFHDILADAGVTFRLIPPCGHISRVRRIRAELRLEKPDIVISFLDTPNFLACFCKLTWTGKFRLIVSERNTDTGPLPFRRRLLLALFGVADLVVANARVQTDRLALVPWLKGKVRWIPNCVDLDRFHPSEKLLEDNISGSLRVLVVASFQPHKNPMLLARWVVGQGHADQRFVFDWYGNQLLESRPTAADGNAYLEARNLIGDSTVLRMYPPAKDIERIYRVSDAFCLPSFYEGTPNVICEAMASSLPILCSRVCDNPYIVQDGVNGFLFDPNDLQSFAESLDKLHALGVEGRMRMGRLNRARAELLFSEHTYVDSWLKVLS